MASLAGMGLGCFEHELGRSGGVLRLPPMDSHSSLVGKAQASSSRLLFDGGSLLGWSCLVAPTSKTAKIGDTSVENRTPVGSVHKLPGRENASYKMAPSLPDTIRVSMESRQISSTDIQKHLNNIKSLQRYDRAFRTFWAYALERGEDPWKMSLAQIGAMLQNFNDLSSAEARHAYAALLLIPSYEQLRFSPFLKGCKRLWNHTSTRYSEFWDASVVLKKLSAQPSSGTVWKKSETDLLWCAGYCSCMGLLTCLEPCVPCPCRGTRCSSW